MNLLSKISLKNSVAVLILFALIMGYGVYSATQIKQQTFPDIEFPAVFIQAINPGASTEEMETGVTKPIEDSLKNFAGYDSLTSTSTENASSISIQFPFGSDMDKLSTDIEASVAKLKLPENAKVSVQRLSAGAMPIYQAAIFSTGKDSGELTRKLEDDVVPALQKLEGVSSVTLKGAASDQLQIVVDKEKASRLGISLSSIQTALQGLNYALPLGNVNEGETTIPIRLSGSATTLQQIKDLPLGPAGGVGGGVAAAPGSSGGAGQQQARGAAGGAQVATPPPAIKLSDIATVTSSAQVDEITRYNGEPSFVLEVVKTQDANTADVGDAVQSLLDSYKNDHIEAHVISNQGEEIKESVNSLIREGLYGALFCIIIIFLFLRNVRATLISILSLPISIFATIAVMNQMGYTLNIMTLGGIAVSIGRIVDDSIVVIENIYRWRQEKGTSLKSKDLTYRATKEVISPVLSSTIATVVVFAPLGFVNGVIGEFFRPFSLAVVISIVASLLVAVMLIPVLGASFFKKVKPHKSESKLTGVYERLIKAALKRKWLVMILSLVLLAGSLSTIPLLGVAFLPADSVPTASIQLTLPAGSGTEQGDQVSKKVESYVKDLNGVTNYQVAVGGSADNPMRSSGSTANRATVTAQFTKDIDMEAVIDKAKADLPALVENVIPGTTVTVRAGEQQGLPSGNNIDVSLYSDNMDDLSKASKQIEDLMGQNSNLKDVTNNMNEVTPKWELTLNQQGIDEKVSPYVLMQAVSEQLKPVHAGSYTLDNKEQTVTLSYRQQITSLEELKSIPVPTAGGIRTLGDVADISVRDALVTVNHNDGKTYARVSGTVKGDNTSVVTREVQKDISALSLPDGVEVSYGGGMAMMQEGFTNLGIAMAAAVGLVFLVMSITFGGVVTPLIILSSLIFIPVGSLGALLVTGQALSMSGMIGMLMLVGIVVTNAVVLLDRVEKNRKSGQPITEAIVEACKTRLRPILMTALATMLALLPLALSGSSTSLISGGLAVTVIGGLFTSTLLTLIVVPVLYEIVWKKRKVREVENF
ncbi:efflux RND transporter permease subunit [Paenibacillus agri]|uniref:Efflux RND transporter permease subunit n=1 Tax=Paenibacillus agri TaxID=2744309 RepID=A0A850ETN0_9BACL|nr:efflux RND transporter permease subunit [Paenibacillus agri]NUU61301.1 efflux RND transporter permease subunit [Paenibacillus agri]